MATSLLDITTLAELHRDLVELRREVATEAAQILTRYSGDDGAANPSRSNFAHYLALRNRDLRPLQDRLARTALSSLGRSEAHVMATLERLVALLELALGLPSFTVAAAPLDFDAGERLLRAHRERLFGPLPVAWTPHIMVTLPAAAATDPILVDELLRSGMDCARINCAHDTPEQWQAMIDHVRAAATAQRRTCRILMDLAGPKLRTGAITAEPTAITLTEIVRLVAGHPAAAHDDDPVALGFPASLIAALQVGDHIAFIDRRGKQRTLEIETGADGDTGAVVGRCARRAVIDGATVFQFPNAAVVPVCAALVEEPAAIRLHEGDQLLLTRDQAAGRAAPPNPDAGGLRPASVPCGEPRVLDYLSIGEDVWIDDGKLGGVIDHIDEAGALLTITHAGPRGRKLRADKGLNFPASRLDLPALTAKDYRDLDFVAAHADLVGLSFAQSLADLELLAEALAARDAGALPIIAKIETARGVENLPEMLLGAPRSHPLGVMIARGDLMVEIGGERMAEMQEEILWLCEAAQVPVIWATQVLETLAQKGTLSRPEITDAAASARADCVMLNKGPHILRAVSLLADILCRMADHQHKKTPRLRALSLSSRIMARAAPTTAGDAD
ncbi:MAG: pyruvate kinase [Porticoccaceae bacterium]